LCADKVFNCAVKLQFTVNEKELYAMVNCVANISIVSVMKAKLSFNLNTNLTP